LSTIIYSSYVIFPFAQSVLDAAAEICRARRRFLGDAKTQPFILFAQLRNGLEKGQAVYLL
jgi:hypothetical protein